MLSASASRGAPLASAIRKLFIAAKNVNGSLLRKTTCPNMRRRKVLARPEGECGCAAGAEEREDSVSSSHGGEREYRIGALSALPKARRATTLRRAASIASELPNGRAAMTKGRREEGGGTGPSPPLVPPSSHGGHQTAESSAENPERDREGEGDLSRLARRTNSLLRGLATLCSVMREYSPSDMKTSVYNVVTGLVTEVPQFRAFVEEMEFLSPPLCIFPVQNGVFAYTVEERQMNVHFVVPARGDDIHELLDELASKIQAPLFRNMSVNLRPLLMTIPDVKGACFVPRRQVPSDARAVRLLEGHRRAVFRDVEMEVVKVLSDRREISSFAPLSKMYQFSVVDADRLFWTDTACGKIVVVRNPPIPFVHGKEFPVASEADCFSSDSTLPFFLFVRALRPNAVSAVVRCLAGEGVPNYAKSIVCRLAVERFGLVDDIVAAVGSLVQERKVTLTEVNLDMLKVYKVMTICKSEGFNADFVVSSLLKILQNTCHADLWSEWTLRSRFVYFLTDHLHRDAVARLCAGFAGFAEALMNSLFLRVGSWSRHDVENSHVFLSESDAVRERATDPAACVEKTETIRREVDRLFRASADFEEEDRSGGGRGSTSPSKRNVGKRREGGGRRKRKEKQRGKAGAEVRQEKQREPFRPEERRESENHNDFVEQKIRRRWPQFSWRLIGSGVFTDTGDVDVVATVFPDPDDAGQEPTLTFDDAVALVEKATGFHPVTATGGSSGRKLVVLVGEIEGKHVDVQVVRASCGEKEGAVAPCGTVRRRTVTTIVTTTTERSSSSSRSTPRRRTSLHHSRVTTKTSTTSCSSTEETFEAGTASERITASAVSLARSIEAQSDSNTLSKAKTLHSWFSACGMKGNKICNLPGVAVTCIAIVIACRNSDAHGGVVFLLRMVREVLVREGVFDFDEMARFVDARRDEGPPSLRARSSRRSAGRVEEGRPAVPLCVIVNDQNVASRTTAAWTRHLLDTVAFALSLGADDALSRAAYDRWRRESMARAAILVEKDAGAVAQTLHSALLLLDDSPLVDTYHVREFSVEGEAGATRNGVEVLCSVCPFAPSRYSFRGADPPCPSAIRVAKNSYRLAPLVAGARSVAVSKGEGKGEWPLLVSEGDAEAADLCGVTKCTEWIRVGQGKRIPNTPTLTVDVIRYFDATRWEAIV